MTLGKTINKLTFALLLITEQIYLSPALGSSYSDACHLSHEGCMRGCGSIENLYYAAQCHGACGTGLAQCRDGC